MAQLAKALPRLHCQWPYQFENLIAGSVQLQCWSTPASHPRARAQVPRAPHEFPQRQDHAKSKIYSFWSLHHFKRGDKFRHPIALGGTQAADHRRLHGVGCVGAIPGEQYVHAVERRAGNVQRIQLGLPGQSTTLDQILSQFNDVRLDGEQWNLPQAVNSHLRGNSIPPTDLFNDAGEMKISTPDNRVFYPCLGHLLTSRLQGVIAGPGRQITKLTTEVSM